MSAMMSPLVFLLPGTDKTDGVDEADGIDRVDGVSVDESGALFVEMVLF